MGDHRVAPVLLEKVLQMSETKFCASCDNVAYPTLVDDRVVYKCRSCGMTSDLGDAPALRRVYARRDVPDFWRTGDSGLVHDASFPVREQACEKCGSTTLHTWFVEGEVFQIEHSRHRTHAVCHSCVAKCK